MIGETYLFCLNIKYERDTRIYIVHRKQKKEKLEEYYKWPSHLSTFKRHNYIIFHDFI